MGFIGYRMRAWDSWNGQWAGLMSSKSGHGQGGGDERQRCHGKSAMIISNINNQQQENDPENQ